MASFSTCTLGDYPNTSAWGKSLITDVNKALSSIENNIKTGFDELRLSLKQEVTSAVISAIDGIVKRVEITERNVQCHDIKLGNLEKQMNAVISENSELRSQIMYIESRERRMNLIFKGISEAPTETERERISKTKSILKSKMGFSENVLNELNFVRCIRLYGQKQNNIRPICVTFHNMNDRQKVWDARGKLKNTPEYYICEDYAPEMQRRRRKLYQILNVAKTLPSYKDHTTVKFDKLICHGKKYTCESLFSLPSPINPRHTSELSTADTILFGGPNSDEHPFCNWKRLDTPLVYEDVSFVTSEQAYLYQQAKFCKDENACSNILSSDDPADAKMYSHKIQNLDKAEWAKVKRGVMENILRLKFRDEKLARELLDTGIKHLHEAGRDTYWATGVTLGNKNALNAMTWTGDSALGQILMEIRKEIGK